MERKYFKSLTDEERKQLKKNIFLQLNIDDAKQRRKSPIVKLLAFGVAASVLVAVGLFALQSTTKSTSEKIFIARTAAGETKQIMLEDSSVVVLNAGSELYSNNFSSGSREVFLNGNGFFKVKKLASKQKFIVHAKKLDVTVLGTQFNVNARTEQVAVALTSGKVQVNTTGNAHAEYLLPGDKIQLDADNATFTREKIDPSLYAAWIEGEWNFRNLTLQEIALLIKEYYDVDVVFENKAKMNYRMTAVIPANTLQNLVKVIAATLDVQISQINNRQLSIQ